VVGVSWLGRRGHMEGRSGAWRPEGGVGGAHDGPRVAARSHGRGGHENPGGIEKKSDSLSLVMPRHRGRMEGHRGAWCVV
jgi:hypothetical protein